MKPYKQTISSCFPIKQKDQIRKICTKSILFNHLITFKDFSSVLISLAKLKNILNHVFFQIMDYYLFWIKVTLHLCLKEMKCLWTETRRQNGQSKFNKYYSIKTIVCSLYKFDLELYLSILMYQTINMLLSSKIEIRTWRICFIMSIFETVLISWYGIFKFEKFLSGKLCFSTGK